MNDTTIHPCSVGPTHDLNPGTVMLNEQRRRLHKLTKKINSHLSI